MIFHLGLWQKPSMSQNHTSVQASATLLDRFSSVISLWRFIFPFVIAKNCSMWFNSGEYAGRYITYSLTFNLFKHCVWCVDRTIIQCEVTSPIWKGKSLLRTHAAAGLSLSPIWLNQSDNHSCTTIGNALLSYSVTAFFSCQKPSVTI